MRSVNQQKLKEVLKLIDSMEDYTFKVFLPKHKLDVDSEHKGHDLMIKCIRNEDLVPSTSVDLERNMFKCFSCGDHGKFLDFYASYLETTLNKKFTFFDAIEYIIKNDPRVSISLGIQSIYTEDKKVYTEDDFKLKSKRIKRVSNKLTLRDVTLKWKKRLTNIEDRMMLISMIQQDLSPMEIDNMMLTLSNTNTNPTSSVPTLDKLSIESILEGDE